MSDPVKPEGDILAALSDTDPTRGTEKCPLGKFLDEIPPDRPGRDELVRLVETPFDPLRADTRSAPNIAKALARLGFSKGKNPILDHRGKSCRCHR